MPAAAVAGGWAGGWWRGVLLSLEAQVSTMTTA